MPTVRELIANIRSRAGSPPYGKVGNGDILFCVYDEIDHLLNRLNLTDENWIVGRKTISVNTDVDEYPMPPEFGRIVLVETIDDADPNHVRRELQVLDVQDFDWFWSGYKNIIGSGYKHNSTVCATFNLNTKPQRTIKFAPPPSDAADYRVWYEIGRQPPPLLADTPRLMEQFHNLLTTGVALQILPRCGHGDNDYIKHRDQLTWSYNRYDPVFKEYINQSHHEDAGPRRAYNSSRNHGGEDW